MRQHRGSTLCPAGQRAQKKEGKRKKFEERKKWIYVRIHRARALSLALTDALTHTQAEAKESMRIQDASKKSATVCAPSGLVSGFVSGLVSGLVSARQFVGLV